MKNKNCLLILFSVRVSRSVEEYINIYWYYVSTPSDVVRRGTGDVLSFTYLFIPTPQMFGSAQVQRHPEEAVQRARRE